MTTTIPARYLVWRAGSVPIVELTYDDKASAMAKAEEMVRTMPDAGPVNVMRRIARLVPGRTRPAVVVQRSER